MAGNKPLPVLRPAADFLRAGATLVSRLPGVKPNERAVLDRSCRGR